jgi:hypothetical protein
MMSLRPYEKIGGFIVAIRAKVLLFICLIFLMESLVAEKRDYSPEERKVINRCVAEVVDALEKEMKKQYGFICIGEGGGMPYDIEEIGMRFLREQQTSIDEARELEIRATERFVEIINNHKEIRPYLRDYPWNHSRARVTIAFRNEKGKDYPEGVTFILQARDKMFYFGPERAPNDVDNVIKEEPYAEAKKIVESSPSCLKPIEKPVKKKSWFGWL